MSKIIALVQLVIGKVLGHKYTGFTVKTPFINFSFAPTAHTYYPIKHMCFHRSVYRTEIRRLA